MKLIVGLGNPGRLYANNRHNIGFICLNHFAKSQGIRFYKKQAKARMGFGEVAGNQIILAKPQIYMNSSGLSVSRLVKRFNVDLRDFLVTYDDLDLPLGTIRLRQDGGSGGHKGVSSIITELGSQDFPRLRVGIGRPATAEISEADIIAYVLSDFTAEEKQVITQLISRVSQAILCFLTEGLVAAMNKYNPRW